MSSFQEANKPSKSITNWSSSASFHPPSSLPSISRLDLIYPDSDPEQLHHDDPKGTKCASILTLSLWRKEMNAPLVPAGFLRWYKWYNQLPILQAKLSANYKNVTIHRTCVVFLNELWFLYIFHIYLHIYMHIIFKFKV